MTDQQHQTDKPCTPAGEILGYAAYKRVEEDGSGVA